ncbi:Phosphate-specific transport system accessory protein PhoU homolog(Signal transduction response regulator, phosphate regulon transcriptional regulatory protein PhoB,20-107) [Magnetospirillum sp. XM-1]|uniref:phosphate signaling complex protein PhoU n=1 Tax=Magnetospirillum sp. XM-1 TaxID=1663591 RepID=UPI00073DFAD4|nr:phosphate signaling complex protein PhoU [Magnetospirillum sp. XM-1]CUW39066.1 Phosphate-specific transport system accessory protein PhoU homolog(Signal transduction response regulator, phosphate regulon transcriptional regulatory protein PhoB,20-107) [Magnetospirillum sp. XM-1]
MSDHTVKSYDDELAHLSGMIARMGGLAEAQLGAALQSLARRDDELAQRVIDSDCRIDELDHEVDSFAVRLLALRQPMAGDLRHIVAALNISGEIERIGDYAANLAKRTLVLNQIAATPKTAGVVRLGELVLALLKDILDAYVDKDLQKAIGVWGRDEEVDSHYNTVFRDLIAQMTEDSGTITASTHLLFIAKNMERIGDHATNIAETLHFQILGTQPKGDRPKGAALGAPE